LFSLGVSPQYQDLFDPRCLLESSAFRSKLERPMHTAYPRQACRFVPSLLLAAIWAPRACFAQNWAATRLHTDGFFTSKVLAITPEYQAGFLHGLSGPYLPSLWTGSGQSRVTYGQPWSGVINGTDGQTLVGELDVPMGHAVIWHLNQTSWTDLHPSGALLSRAYATSGGQQVGEWWTPSSQVRAALWFGTTQSFFDLHPAGMVSSRALATDGYAQGGFVSLPSGRLHAARWGGSAISYVDMNPAGSFESEILGMSSAQQVGSADFGSGTHAVMWRGSPNDYTDLNPPGAGVSVLYATCGSAQVGYANVVGLGVSAGIWQGTAASFIPLSPSLPPGYFNSVATCVAEQGGTYYVGGYAWNAATFQPEAFMWVGQVPAPGMAGTWLAAFAFAVRRRR
jgi:hypothetical protein